MIKGAESDSHKADKSLEKPRDDAAFVDETPWPNHHHEFSRSLTMCEARGVRSTSRGLRSRDVRFQRALECCADSPASL
jgi:hypothetical protein